VRCRPDRIRAVAATLARRPDTVWVDVLGGGDEFSVVLFLDGPDARNALLLADLPATAAVRSWRAYTVLRVFPAAFVWTAGLLTDDELAALRPAFADPPAALAVPTGADDRLLAALARDGRASYTELADATGTTPLTARRRLTALVDGWAVRAATEVDLALLGVHAEALLWLTVEPGSLDHIGIALSAHPWVRFTAATTGPTNLLVAVAAADLSALYEFLTTTVGPLDRISAVETTPILVTAKRTGLIRHQSA
jgi:DNA-binding Lrp family transcriptional regulator